MKNMLRHGRGKNDSHINRIQCFHSQGLVILITIWLVLPAHQFPNKSRMSVLISLPPSLMIRISHHSSLPTKRTEGKRKEIPGGPRIHFPQTSPPASKDPNCLAHSIPAQPSPLAGLSLGRSGRSPPSAPPPPPLPSPAAPLPSPLNGDGLGVGAPGVGEVGPEARRPRRSSLVPLPFAPPQAPVYRPIWLLTDRRALAGKQVQAALLLNYDPSGPSRLLPVMWALYHLPDCFDFYSFRGIATNTIRSSIFFLLPLLFPVKSCWTCIIYGTGGYISGSGYAFQLLNC